MLDDETLLKAFLKKQKEIQDKFLLDFTRQKVSVDTNELKSIVSLYEFTVRQAENLRPKIDTSGVQISIDRAVNSAVDNAKFTALIESVDAQTKAIERNNLILEQGTGRMVKWWITLIIALFSFGVGWGVNWYFKIPEQIVGANRYKTLQALYDEVNNTLASDCNLTKHYYKVKGWKWDNACNHIDENGNTITNLPLKTSDSVISGH